VPFDPDQIPTPDLGLRCMSCGYPLAGLTKRVCPECGATFDYEAFVPKGDFPMLIVDGEAALLTPDIRDALRRAKVPCIELGGLTMDLYGLHSISQSRSLVGVPRSQYFDAVIAVRSLRDGGVDEPPQDFAIDWTCAACGEENPGSFEICWQCGGDRPSDAPRII